MIVNCLSTSPICQKLFRYVLLLCVTTSGYVSRAQEVKVQGGFLTDSTKIGEETGFYLSARYREELMVLFPDSSFDFHPFEYERRSYFTTRTSHGISIDSAVYYFTTFEVDRTQYLGLPVFLVQPQDCTTYHSAPDSILLTQLVAHVPDSISVDKLPLKMNTAYQEVHFQLNFWIIIIVAAIIAVIAIAVWLVFGKKITAYLRAKKLERAHKQFMERYDSSLSQLGSAFSSALAERALSTWKKYMEQLEAHPYTKLTTKETAALLRDEQLTFSLRTIDKAIYGHNREVLGPLEELKAFANNRFSKKLEEVKHG